MKYPTSRSPGVTFSASGKVNGVGSAILVRNKLDVSLGMQFALTSTGNTNNASYTHPVFTGTNWVGNIGGILSYSATSPTSWTSSGVSYNAWAIFDFGGGKLAATVNNDSKYSSDHGVTWSNGTGWASNASGVSFSHNGSGTGIVTNIESGSGSYQYTSNYGQTFSWNSLPTNPGAQTFIMYSGNMFLAFAYGSTQGYYSTNGVDWTSTTLPHNQCNRAVKVRNNQIFILRYGSDNVLVNTELGYPVYIRMTSPPTTGFYYGSSLGNGIVSAQEWNGSPGYILFDYGTKWYKHGHTFGYITSNGNGMVYTSNNTYGDTPSKKYRTVTY